MVLRNLFLAVSAAYPVLADLCGVHGSATRLPDLQLLGRRAPIPPTVDLYVHVVAGSRSRQDGWLSVCIAHN